MESFEWLSTAGSIGYFLAAFPALWISGRMLLRNYPGDHRPAHLFIWLALGGLILIPIADFLRYTISILSLIVPLFWSSATITVFLGMGPFMVSSGITTALGIVVYGLALSSLRPIVVGYKIPIMQAYRVEKWELGFVRLGIAGLANRMVSGLVIGFISMYLPRLTEDKDLAQLLSGFWITWLLAFLLLLVTLWVMYERLSRREIELPL